MTSKDYGPSHIPSASQLEESGYSGSHSSPAVPRSMKEAGKHFANLKHQVEKLLKERDQFYAQIERFKGHHRQLLIECNRDVEDGMKRLEDESAEEEEESYVFVQPEQPESVRLHNRMQSLNEYLRRQELSERVIVGKGQCFHTPHNRAREGDGGSLACAEECTERTSEREEQLERQVAELEAEVYELSQRLAEACETCPEAPLSSDEVSESFSKVERGVLIRSQSAPDRLLTAYKKIEVLQEIYDSLMAEKKETESTLERSLNTVKSLDESLEEERLEKYKAMGGMKQLKTELEGLKERVARKPVQKAKCDTHSRRLFSSALGEPPLSKIERKERREMKGQLDRTVAEKLQLEEEAEGLFRTKAEEEDDLHSHSRLSQGEGVLMSEVKTLKLELASVKEELQSARRDADQARQKRREMKDRLDSTFGEKLVLEEKLEDQKEKAKEWKMKLDETTAKLCVKEEEFELLQEGLRRRQK